MNPKANPAEINPGRVVRRSNPHFGPSKGLELPSAPQIHPLDSVKTHYYNDSSNSVPGVDWPTCSKSYFVNQNMLTNDPTTNPDWWVSGGTDYPDSYSVKLDKGLFFNNGQYVSLHPEGRIDMRKPNAEIIAQTTEVNVIGSTLIF